MRLFVGAFAGINGYEKLKKRFDSLLKGRWVDESSLHVTFKFLGEVEDEKEIIASLKGIEYPKGEVLRFEKLGLFGEKILLASCEDEVLYRINSRIEERLQNRYEKSKEFIPHITLMRIKRVVDKSFFEVLKESRADISLKLNVALIKSEGGRYEKIMEF